MFQREETVTKKIKRRAFNEPWILAGTDNRQVEVLGTIGSPLYIYIYTPRILLSNQSMK